jgi:uncharacterized protein (TIGR03435 family)
MLAGLLALAVQAQTITPSALRFEVASVKPSSGSGDCFSHDPGRFTCKQSLQGIIFVAFQVPAYQQLDPAFAKAGKGYQQVYEIAATVPKETAQNWGLPKGNFQEQKAMLRNLLIDRFKLAYHYDKKEVQGYTLTANKAGFKPKSDPNAKPIGAPKDYVPPAGSVLARQHAPAENWLDVTRASMVEFAAGLSKFELQGVPVTDDTGLKGIYSFNFAF